MQLWSLIKLFRIFLNKKQSCINKWNKVTCNSPRTTFYYHYPICPKWQSPRGRSRHNKQVTEDVSLRLFEQWALCMRIFPDMVHSELGLHSQIADNKPMLTQFLILDAFYLFFAAEFPCATFIRLNGQTAFADVRFLSDSRPPVTFF